MKRFTVLWLVLAAFIFCNARISLSAPVITYCCVCEGVGPEDANFFRKPIGEKTTFKQHDNVQLFVEVFMGDDFKGKHRFTVKKIRDKAIWDSYQSPWINKEGKPFPVSHFTPMMPDAFEGKWTYEITIEIPGATTLKRNMSFKVIRTDPDYIVDGLHFCRSFKDSAGVKVPIGEGTKFYQSQKIESLLTLRNVYKDYRVKRELYLNGTLKETFISGWHWVSLEGNFWPNAYYNFAPAENQVGENEVKIFITSSDSDDDFKFEAGGKYSVLPDPVEIGKSEAAQNAK